MKKILLASLAILLISVFAFSYFKLRQSSASTVVALQNGSLGLANIESGYPEFKTTSDCGELVKHKSLSLMFCDKFKEPIWVAYILTKEEINSDSKTARSNKFKPDPLVSTGTAATADYTKSGFDRGHIAPNADMNWDQTSMEECFYMSNITPQQPSFNRGIWKSLEEAVRKWAVKYDSLYVVAGPDLRDVTEYIGKSNKIGVPKYFYKVVLDVKGPEYNGIAFYFPNEKSDKSIFDYAISIRDLEKKIGCDFFPKLNKRIMAKLETDLKTEVWNN